MNWEKQYAEKEFSIKAGIAKKRPLPQWFLDEPFVDRVDEFYIQGFRSLSTERQIGMSVGPIPNSKIYEYSKRKGLDSENSLIFEAVITQIDNHYLEDLRAKEEAAKNK